MMTNYRAKATLKVSMNFLPSGSCNPESGADRSTWEGLRVGSFYPLDGGWVNNPLGDTEIGSGIATWPKKLVISFARGGVDILVGISPDQLLKYNFQGFIVTQFRLICWDCG